MKKLLGLTMAAAMVLPSAASAELLKNLKTSGSLEVDSVSVNNGMDYSSRVYDKVNTIQSRVLLGADWDLLDDVHSHVTMRKNNRTYGTGAESLHTVQTVVFFDEANVKVEKLFGSLDMTLGRQFYGEAGDLVIYFGPKMGEYTMPVTALDGARLDWKGEKTGVTFLAAKRTGSAVAVDDFGNVNLTGVDVHVKASDNVTGGGYLYNQVTINSNNRAAAVNVTGSDRLYVFGLKGKMTMGNAWAKAELAKNFGQNRTVDATAAHLGRYTFTGNYTGWALKLDGGYKADLGMGALTGWGQYGLGSGGANRDNTISTARTFQPIAGDYRPGNIFGRFISNADLGQAATFNGSLQNLQVIGLGVKANPSTWSKLTAGLSFYNFRLQNQAGANAAATALTGITTAGGKHFGNELDLDLGWQHSENVMIAAGVGSFQPGTEIRHVNQVLTGGSVSPVTLGYMDFSFKF